MVMQQSVEQEEPFDYIFIVGATDLASAGGQAALDAAYPDSADRTSTVQTALGLGIFTGWVEGITPNNQRAVTNRTPANATVQRPRFGPWTLTLTLELVPQLTASGRSDDYAAFYAASRRIPTSGQLLVAAEWGFRDFTANPVANPDAPLKRPHNGYWANIYKIINSNGPVNWGQQGWGTLSLELQADGLEPKGRG